MPAVYPHGSSYDPLTGPSSLRAWRYVPDRGVPECFALDDASLGWWVPPWTMCPWLMCPDTGLLTDYWQKLGFHRVPCALNDLQTIHEVCASGNPSDPLIEVYQQFFTPFPHFLNRGAEKGLSPIRGRANFRELLEMASYRAWNLIPQVGKTIDIYVLQTLYSAGATFCL